MNTFYVNIRGASQKPFKLKNYRVARDHKFTIQPKKRAAKDNILFQIHIRKLKKLRTPMGVHDTGKFEVEMFTICMILIHFT